MSELKLLCDANLSSVTIYSPYMHGKATREIARAICSSPSPPEAQDSSSYLDHNLED